MEMKNLFFKPELVPATSHRLLENHHDMVFYEILIRHLYTYLDFTETLEHSVVNQVAFNIGRGRFPIDLPRKMRLDAYKLYVDEAYHAMFSADLAAQIEDATGVMAIRGIEPAFLKKLEKVRSRVPPNKVWLVDLLFTTVSETLISGTLTKVPGDERVVKAVRETLRDHADDEAIHHAYFAKVLEITWPTLSAHDKETIGPFLPDFIRGFLEPDLYAIKVNLQAAGLTRKEAQLVTQEQYTEDDFIKSAQDIAAVTLRHFRNTGMFEIPSIYDAFGRSGFEAMIK